MIHPRHGDQFAPHTAVRQTCCVGDVRRRAGPGRRLRSRPAPGRPDRHAGRRRHTSVRRRGGARDRGTPSNRTSLMRGSTGSDHDRRGSQVHSIVEHRVHERLRPQDDPLVVTALRDSRRQAAACARTCDGDAVGVDAEFVGVSRRIHCSVRHAVVQRRAGTDVRVPAGSPARRRPPEVARQSAPSSPRSNLRRPNTQVRRRGSTTPRRGGAQTARVALTSTRTVGSPTCAFGHRDTGTR